MDPPGSSVHGTLQAHFTRQPTPGFLSEKFYRQRSLVNYSPWGRKKSDMTESTFIQSACLQLKKDEHNM
ncbi:hypothetical protein CapIbe_015901 [Capra ibex]